MPDDEAGRWRKVAESLWEVVRAGDKTAGEQTPAPATTAARCEPPMSPPNPEWRWLSPLEEQVLAVVAPDRDTPAERIAEALKIPCSGEFRFLLRNLVSRRILDSSGKGYRLRPASTG